MADFTEKLKEIGARDAENFYKVYGSDIPDEFKKMLVDGNAFTYESFKKFVTEEKKYKKIGKSGNKYYYNDTKNIPYGATSINDSSQMIEVDSNGNVKSIPEAEPLAGGGSSTTYIGGGKFVELTESQILAQFSPAPYYYASIPPFKGIKIYDVSKITTKPKVAYSQLGTSGVGQATTFPFKYNGKTNIDKRTAGGKKNNPLNISHSKSDIGYLGASAVADGQMHAAYDTLEHGIASAMRLLKRKYGNRSIIGYNDGFQGYYRTTEGKSKSALRVIWITNFSNRTNIPPEKVMNISDKETMFCLCHAIAIQETHSYLGRDVLERAWACGI